MGVTSPREVERHLYLSQEDLQRPRLVLRQRVQPDGVHAHEELLDPVGVDVVGPAHEVREVVDVVEAALGEVGPLPVGPVDLVDARLEAAADLVHVRGEETAEVGDDALQRAVGIEERKYMLVLWSSKNRFNLTSYFVRIFCKWRSLWAKYELVLNRFKF